LGRSPDGTRLASGGFDGALRVWDAGSPCCKGTLYGVRSGAGRFSLDPQMNQVGQRRVNEESAP